MMWWSWFLFAASLALQVLVIASLRRGALKDYSVVFGYCLVLILAVLAAVSISLEIHSASSGKFILWVTQVARDLSFASVVLTLVLWLILISSRKKDHQLLMVTGGLGLQFTGEAIGQSLRQV